MQNLETGMAAKSGHLYQAFWRWHFYAGLLVIPFLFMLSVSGMLMLLSKPVDSFLQKDLLWVEPQEQMLSATSQLAVIESNFPHSSVQLYIPQRHVSGSAQFSLVAQSATAGHGGHGAPSTTVYLNPYNGEILGELDPAQSVYARIKAFHGTLYMGDIGDSLIEIAAGFAVLMVLTGIYLARPAGGWRTLIPVRRLSSRSDWRRLHGFFGLLVAVPLLFFLLSGLAWTNVWGGQLVQAWSSLPGTRFEVPAATVNYDSMNQHGLHQVPWALEQTPMPQSGAIESVEAQPVEAQPVEVQPGETLLGETGHTFDNSHAELTLERVTQIAAEQGFVNYRVHLPQDETSVWTISATTIAGDLTNPNAERTVYLDRFSGEVLADIRFADYPAMGRAMAAFVPIHQGDLGGWNLTLNLVFCSLVVLMIISGVLLWLKRLSNSKGKLVPPAAPVAMRKAVVISMLAVALCFPLSAAVMAVVLILDWLLFSRFGQLKADLK